MTDESYPDIEEARQLHRQLDEIFSKEVGGWADTETLAKVERLCAAARYAVADAYCREKIGDVAGRAADLFSARKHRKWDRGPQAGSVMLRVWIGGSLNSFESRLGTIEGIRRAGSLDAYMRALAQPPKGG